jgi:hypothetical protein
MKLRLGGWVAAVSVLQGCSWISVNGPPPAHEQIRYFDCTTEDYAAGLDVYLAVSYVASGVLVAVAASESHEVEAGHGVGIGASAVGAGLHGLSAAYGYETTKACRQARSAAAARAHDDLTGAIRGGRDRVAESSGDELAIEVDAGQTPSVATTRTDKGEEEIRLSMTVGASRLLIKVVPAVDARATFGYQINAPMDGSQCQLRIAADGQAVAVQEQYASTSATAAKQSIWAKLAIDQLAVLAASRRVVVRACAEQAELGAREIAAIDAFVLRALESIALQSDAAPKPAAAAPAPTPAPAPLQTP